MGQATVKLLQDYYAAFNMQDMDTFLSLLSDDVIHDINQGAREVGKDAFVAFMERMNKNYKETIVDIEVMTNTAGDRATRPPPQVPIRRQHTRRPKLHQSAGVLNPTRSNVCVWEGGKGGRSTEELGR